MMLQEKNRAALQSAIRQLPVYEPAEGIWEGISRRLEEAEKETGLQASLHQLPVYSPPESVWEGIAAELISAPAGEKEGKVWPLYRRIPRSVAAAVALLLGALTWLLLPGSEEARVTIVRQEITLPDTELAAGWDDDETAFETVQAQFAEHPLLRQNPKMQRLSRELEELDAAKAEIESVMDSYGRDADLIRRIGQIERERSDVLKRMVALN